jgi:hypothetical protein
MIESIVPIAARVQAHTRSPLLLERGGVRHAERPESSDSSIGVLGRICTGVDAVFDRPLNRHSVLGGGPNGVARGEALADAARFLVADGLDRPRRPRPDRVLGSCWVRGTPDQRGTDGGQQGSPTAKRRQVIAPPPVLL